MTWLRLITFLNVVVFCSSSSVFAQKSSQSKADSKPPLLNVVVPNGGSAKPRVRFSPNGQTLACYKAAFSYQFMTATTTLSDLAIYSVATGNKVLTIANGWEGFVLSPDSRKLLCWDDKTISIWNIEEAELVSMLQIPNVYRVSFVREGEWFVTESTSGERNVWDSQPVFVKFWDSASLKPVETPIHQRGPWFDPVVTADGKTFVGFEKDHCSILDVATGTALPAPKNVTPGGSFKPGTRVTSDGQYVIFNTKLSEADVQTNLDNSLLVFWRLATSEPINVGSFFSIKALSNVDTKSSLSQQNIWAYHSNNINESTVYLENLDKRWILKRTLTDEPLQEFPDRTTRQPSDGVKFDRTSSNRLLISLSPRSIPTVWGIDLREGNQTAIGETNGAITNIAISHDGNRLAISEDCSPSNDTFSERIAIWDIKLRKQISLIDPYQSPQGHFPIDSICFFPDGRMISSAPIKLANGESKPEVLVWDCTTGFQLTTPTNQELPSRIIAVSDDQTLLACSKPNELRILDSRDFKLKQKLVVDTLPSKKGYVTPKLGEVRFAAFSPDKSRLAVLSYFNNDSYLTYWDLSEGKLRFLANLPTSAFDLKFINDGKSIQLTRIETQTHLVIIRRIDALEEKATNQRLFSIPSTDRVIDLHEPLSLMFGVGNLHNNQIVVAGMISVGDKFVTKLFQMDANTGKVLRMFELENFKVEGLVAANNDHRVIVRGSTVPKRTAYILDTQSGDVVSKFENCSIEGQSPNGKYILVKDIKENGLVMVCDAEKGTEFGRITVPGNILDSSGFSPDSQYFFLSHGRGLSVWSIDQFR